MYYMELFITDKNTTTTKYSWLGTKISFFMMFEDTYYKSGILETDW